MAGTAGAGVSVTLISRKNRPDRALELKGRRSTRARIVKVGLDSGEGATFMTNLHEGSAGDIKRLCKKRRSGNGQHLLIKPRPCRRTRNLSPARRLSRACRASWKTLSP